MDSSQHKILRETSSNHPLESCELTLPANFDTCTDSIPFQAVPVHTIGVEVAERVSLAWSVILQFLIRHINGMSITAWSEAVGGLRCRPKLGSMVGWCGYRTC